MADKVPAKDYYKTLEATPISTLDDIHKSYRVLTKKYHPDVCEDKELAEKKMKDMTEAYNTLKDIGKRKEYDSSKYFKLRPFNKAMSNYGKKLSFFAALFGKQDNPISKERQKQLQKQYGDKNPVEVSFSMGISYGKMRKPDSIAMAQQEFKKITEIDPKNADAYFNLGLTFYYVGEYSKAFVSFKNASSLNPKDEDAKILLGLLSEDK